MLARIRKFLQLPLQLFANLAKDDCLTWSASLSYATLLSLIPLLASSLVLIKAFPAFSGFEEQLERFIFSHFVAGSAETIQQYVHEFLQHSLKLSVFGSMFLLVTAVLLIFNMEKSFNHIWKVEAHRKGLTAFLMYWGVISLLPLLLVVGVGVGRFVMSLPFLSKVTFDFQLAGFLGVMSQHVFPILLTWIAFTFLYVSVPNCKVRIYSALTGAFFSALLFEVAKTSFTFYARRFSTYEVVYGSFSAIPLFLIWLYITWVIILFGVEITYVLQVGREGEQAGALNQV